MTYNSCDEDNTYVYGNGYYHNLQLPSVLFIFQFGKFICRIISIYFGTFGFLLNKTFRNVYFQSYLLFKSPASL